MDHLIINDLHACVNCLGSLDQGKFIRDVDTNVSIRDILRHLRKESNKCEIRLELSNMNVIKLCLIPLLKCSSDDSILFDLLIRLLMNLTQPAFICFKQQLPDDILMRGLYIKVDEALQRYKLLFADREVLTILASCLSTVFEKPWKSRSEDEHMMIERVLVLMRNVLHINLSNVADQAIDCSWSHHDRVLSEMLDSGWTELIVYLSNSTDEIRFAFHTLEIVSLMFKEQTAETMKLKKSIVSGCIEEDNGELLRLSKQEEESRNKELATLNRRALRLDGFFELPNVKSSSGRPMVYHHDLSSGNIDLSRDRNLRRKPRNRQPVVEKICERKSAKPVLEKLQEFCKLFLEHGYNTLMKTAMKRLDKQSIESDDETYYLWSLKFFTSVCRLGHMTPEFVGETMSHDVFHWVYQQAILYVESAETDKKKARTYFRKLQLTIGTYNEMLHFLLMLDRHRNEKYRQLSVQIKSSVFYREEYMDLYPLLLRKYKEAVQTRVLLRDLIEGSYLIIRILDNHKSFNMNVVRKLKKKRKAPTKKTAKVLLEGVEEGIVMPSDNQEDLLRLWDRISDIVTAAVNGQAQLSEEHQLPCIFDATLADEREPIEPGSEPVDVQLKKALGIVQIYLRQEKPLEAVALLRLARTMWPDEDRIALSEFEESVTQEISMLKTLLLAPTFYIEDDLKVVKKDDEGNKGEEEEDGFEEEVEEEEEFEEKEYVEEEVFFDLTLYLLKFTEPAIVKTYGILFNEITENPVSTNRSLLQIMHRIAIKMCLPVVFYQLRLFSAFSKFLKSPLSTTERFKEERKFSIHIMRLFAKHATTNRKLFVEMLFSKNPKHLMNILTGEQIAKENKSLTWTEELDEELERLCDEVRIDEPLPGCDRINMIMDRFSDPSKTRRQIMCRLIHLGLMESIDIKRKRQSKRIENPWSGEEQARLIVLVEEYKDSPNAIRFIMNGMKAAATVTDPSEARSQRSVVKRILELGLVADKTQLGIKIRAKKGKNSEESEEEEEASDQDNEEMYDYGRDKEKRVPPPMKMRKMVDWTAFKMTFASLDSTERNWFLELLVDNIDTRANGIIGSLALIPLLDEDAASLSSKPMQKLLSICNFLCPDNSNSEYFWRIPEDMGSKELDYFRNCAASLTESELHALTMTHNEETSQVKNATKTTLNIRKKTVDIRELLGSDSDEDDDSEPRRKVRRLLDSDESEVEDSVVDSEKERVEDKIVRRKSKGMFDSEDEEVEDNIIEMKSTGLFDSEKEGVEDKIVDSEKEGVEDNIDGRKSMGLFESDDDDEDTMNVSLKNKRRILDSEDDDDSFSAPMNKKKRIIEEDSD